MKKNDEIKGHLCSLKFKGIDLGYSILPVKPTYGEIWKDSKTGVVRGYNADGEWVEYNETDDETLKEIIRSCEK